VEVHVQVDRRTRRPSKCEDCVQPRQVNQRGKNVAMRGSDLAIGHDLVTPRHFEHEFIPGKGNQIEAQPAMEGRDQQLLEIARLILF
jgi:hypothetical protein